MTSWEFGCRRITPGLPYLQAVQMPNVSIERNPIQRIDSRGIRTVDGNLHEFDIIICATGFDTSFRPRYPIIGRQENDLRELWKNTPEAYLGLAVSGFPNYFSKKEFNWIVNIWIPSLIARYSDSWP